MRAITESAPKPTGKLGNRRREAIRAAVRRPAHALRLKARTRNGSGRPPGGESSNPAATVFVSYAREDLGVVQPLVAWLRAGGLTVIWDQDFPAGVDFERRIRDSIDKVLCTLVVWSRSSAQSAFVRGEAKLALRSGKLVTMHVEGFDLHELPFEFGNLNVIPTHDQAGLQRSLAQHGIAFRA